MTQEQLEENTWMRLVDAYSRSYGKQDFLRNIKSLIEELLSGSVDPVPEDKLLITPQPPDDGA